MNDKAEDYPSEKLALTKSELVEPHSAASLRFLKEAYDWAGNHKLAAAGIAIGSIAAVAAGGMAFRALEGGGANMLPAVASRAETGMGPTWLEVINNPVWNCVD